MESLRRLRDLRRELKKEMEDLTDKMIREERNELKERIAKLENEMAFKEEEWKTERNKLKEKIESLGMRLEERLIQLELENNTVVARRSVASTSDTHQLQSIRPTTDRTESTRGNSVDNLTTGTSGTSENAQCQNSVSKSSGSNKPNVANTILNIRENDASQITSDDVNRSVTESGHSAPGNSRNVNNTTDTGDYTPKILCYCGKPAIEFTVRKEGPNQGRLFFKCYDNYQGINGCDFWQWGPAVSQDNATNKYSSSVSNMDRNNAGVGTSNNNSLTTQADPNEGQSCGARHTVNSTYFPNRENVDNRANQNNFNSFKRPKFA